MGILFALASLVFAGVNDFVFKQYIDKDDEPLGHFVMAVGLIWTVVFGTAMVATRGGFSLKDWPISLGAGLACLVANLLFISSFRVIPAGTGATVYRLNLVVAAVMGVVLLGEQATFWKVIGVGLGAASVLLLSKRQANAPSDKARGRAVVFLAAACVLRASMGILYRLANIRGIPTFEVLTFGGLSWLLGGLAFSLLRREGGLGNGRTWRFSLVSGPLVCGIVFFLLLATESGEASIVVPIAQLSFGLTCVLGLLFHQERLDVRKAVALAAAAMCVLALSWG